MRRFRYRRMNILLAHHIATCPDCLRAVAGALRIIVHGAKEILEAKR